MAATLIHRKLRSLLTVDAVGDQCARWPSTSRGPGVEINGTENPNAPN